MRVPMVVLALVLLPAGARAQQPAQGDTLAAARAEAVRKIQAEIAGKEELPASQVFENVKILGDMPAGRLLAIMNMGYGRSLGVTCAHCHDPENWASDEKPEKQIARDMAAMTDRINGELLPAIPNLKSQRPTVNCSTCHRGMARPGMAR